MLRRKLLIQIVSLGVGVTVSAALTVWTGLGATKVSEDLAQIAHLRSVATHFDLHLDEAGVALYRHVRNPNPDDHQALIETAGRDSKELQTLSEARPQLAEHGVADLQQLDLQRQAAVAEVLTIVQRRQDLLALLLDATDRTDAMMSDRALRDDARLSRDVLLSVAQLEGKLARLVRDLGLYWRTHDAAHLDGLKDLSAFVGRWEISTRRLALDPAARAWIAKLGESARQTLHAANGLADLAKAMSAVLARYERFDIEVDETLEQRLEPELAVRQAQAEARGARARYMFAGSFLLLLLLLPAAIGVLLTVRRRLDTGLTPLLRLAERVSSGDLTSPVDTTQVRDEFQSVAQSLLTMRDSLRGNMLSIERFHAVLDRLGSLRVSVGADGKIREVSRAALRTLGAHANQLEGAPLSALFADEIDVQTLVQLSKEGLLHGQVWDWRHASGGIVPVTLTALDLNDELLLLAQPMAPELAEESLGQSGDGLLLVDAAGTIAQANPAAVGFLDAHGAVLVGKPLAQVFEAAGCDQLMDPEILAYCVQYRHPIGLSLATTGPGKLHLRCTATRLPAQHGYAEKFALTLKDVSELHRSQEEVHQLAFTDTLTGLANRTRLLQFLDDGVGAARRREDKLALLFLDLDGFKEINDTLGHDQGDILLKEVGRRLLAQVRGVDLVARLGGDEFCVVLTGLEDEGAVAALAQRCLDALVQPVVLAGKTISPRGSFGIALYPAHAADPKALMKAADLAMYAAKRVGTQSFAMFDSRMSEELEQRLSLETALRQAIERRELELHYQPKVCLLTGRVVGVEALARWRRPGVGNVPPDTFIPAAQRLGLIDALGVQILERACAQAVAWAAQADLLHPQVAAGRGLPVAVNISPSHFESSGFIDGVARILADSGLAPELLEIEVTESVTRNPKRHAEICGALRKLGVQIAIDDFGTGYSSLSVLKHMDIDTLKLDRQFIHDMTSDASSAVLVGTIIGLAAGLGFAVVAEGVETLEQVQVLSGLGCGFAQGYYFSRPVPPEHIPALARTDFLVRHAATQVAPAQRPAWAEAQPSRHAAEPAEAEEGMPQ
jgi:diguanylate cyclase (GGDEF)-like protein